MEKHRWNNLRPIAIAVTLAFAAEQVAFAAPGVSTIMPASLKPSMNFTLPQSVAVVDDAYKAPGDAKLLILIQDAHTNDSGQMNVAKTLAEVLPKENINTVFTEADSGDVSLNYIKPFFSQEIREKVGRQLVRKGELRGHDYANLTGADFRMIGVEDPALYRKTLEIYQGLVQKRDKVRSYVDQVQRSAQTLKDSLLSDEIKALDAQRLANVRGDLSLADYADTLLKASKRAGLNAARYPHIKFLRRLRAIEQRVDFKKASAEEREAMKLLPKADRDVLLSASRGAKAAASEENGFYALFAEKLKARNVLKRFPDLAKYFDYLKETRKMNALGVVGEVKGLEEELFLTLAKDRDEAVLWMFGRNLETLQNLISLKISPDEFARVKSQGALYDMTLIAGFLNRKISDLGRHYENAITLEASYEAARKDAVEFYELTLERDRVFLDRISSLMDSENIDKAVLITGGYHTPNLKALLKSSGYSYVALLPQVLHETDTVRYERLLLAQLKETAASGNARIASGSRPARQEAAMARQLEGARLAAALTAEVAVPVEQVLAARPQLQAEAVQGARMASLGRAMATNRPAQVFANRAELINYSSIHTMEGTDFVISMDVRGTTSRSLWVKIEPKPWNDLELTLPQGVVPSEDEYVEVPFGGEGGQVVSYLAGAVTTGVNYGRVNIRVTSPVNFGSSEGPYQVMVSLDYEPVQQESGEVSSLEAQLGIRARTASYDVHLAGIQRDVEELNQALREQQVQAGDLNNFLVQYGTVPAEHAQGGWKNPAVTKINEFIQTPALQEWLPEVDAAYARGEVALLHLQGGLASRAREALTAPNGGLMAKGQFSLKHFMGIDIMSIPLDRFGSNSAQSDVKEAENSSYRQGMLDAQQSVRDLFAGIDEGAYKEYLMDLSLGAFEILKYRHDLESIARRLGKDPEDFVRENGKAIVSINSETGAEIVKEWIDHDFFGFDRDNIVFMQANNLPMMTYDESTVQFNVMDESSAESLGLSHVETHVYGHALIAEDIKIKGTGFVINSAGRASYIEGSSPEEYLRRLGVKLMYNRNVDDLTQLRDAIPFNRLALYLSLGTDVTMEVLGNPTGQPGGTAYIGPDGSVRAVEGPQLKMYENTPRAYAWLLNKMFLAFRLDPDQKIMDVEKPIVSMKKVRNKAKKDVPIALFERYFTNVVVNNAKSVSVTTFEGDVNEAFKTVGQSALAALGKPGKAALQGATPMMLGLIRDASFADLLQREFARIQGLSSNDAPSGARLAQTRPEQPAADARTVLGLDAWASSVDRPTLEVLSRSLNIGTSVGDFASRAVTITNRTVKLSLLVPVAGRQEALAVAQVKRTNTGVVLSEVASIPSSFDLRVDESAAQRKPSTASRDLETDLNQQMAIQEQVGESARSMRAQLANLTVKQIEFLRTLDGGSVDIEHFSAQPDKFRLWVDQVLNVNKLAFSANDGHRLHLVVARLPEVLKRELRSLIDGKYAAEPWLNVLFDRDLDEADLTRNGTRSILIDQMNPGVRKHLLAQAGITLDQTRKNSAPNEAASISAAAAAVSALEIDPQDSAPVVEQFVDAVANVRIKSDAQSALGDINRAYKSEDAWTSINEFITKFGNEGVKKIIRNLLIPVSRWIQTMRTIMYEVGKSA